MFGHAMMWFWFPLLFLLVFRPWRRAWRRRDWGGGPRVPRDRGTDEREIEVRDQERQQQIEQLETRVNELESRLDFAERLLAQRREAPLVKDASLYGSTV